MTMLKESTLVKLGIGIKTSTYIRIGYILDVEGTDGYWHVAVFGIN